MQRKRATAETSRSGRSAKAGSQSGDDRPGGCYGIQVLIAGRSKQWRDEVRAEVRRAGYCATTVDSAVDALTVLVLGLPIDVLVTDADLHGELGCSRLVQEARALRPNLGIVFAKDLDLENEADALAGAHFIPEGKIGGQLSTTVREALSARA